MFLKPTSRLAGIMLGQKRPSRPPYLPPEPSVVKTETRAMNDQSQFVYYSWRHIGQSYFTHYSLWASRDSYKRGKRKQKMHKSGDSTPSRTYLKDGKISELFLGWIGNLGTQHMALFIS